MSERRGRPDEDGHDRDEQIFRIEERLALVERLIPDAAAALGCFYDAHRGGFKRTLPEPATDQGSGRTSTNRSFMALLEYVRVRFETTDDPAQDPEITSICANLREVARRFLADLDNARRQEVPGDKENMFTDSHLLMTLGILPGIEHVIGDDSGIAQLAEATRAFGDRLADLNQTVLLRDHGGRVHAEDEIHDLVTLHCVRALDAWRVARGDSPLTFEPSFATAIRDRVLDQMGYASVVYHGKFDPAELMFQIALLNRVGVADADQISAHALAIVLKSQAADGSWPSARSISLAGRRSLYASSYEVALALVNLLLRNLRERQLPRGARPQYLRDEVLEALDRAVQYLAASYLVIPSASANGGSGSAAQTFSGWPDDRSRGSSRIECWATAIALTFFVHYRDALLLVRQQELLRRRDVLPAKRTFTPWPDLEPVLKRPRAIDEHAVRKAIHDPTVSGTLRERLHAQYLAPVVSNWVRRPSGTKSLILYGPPGTGKTTIAEAMAEALHWPLLRISPSDFLREGGLDAIEGTAERVFHDLTHLRRVVVLFDECEEMFRRRDRGQSDTRTASAFITAGMLPRLLRLYKHDWVIFVLATNGELEVLDPAVTRRGRFDHAQRIEHPTLEAQARYLEEKHVGSERIIWLRTALAARLASDGDEKRSRPPVTFKALDGLATEAGAWSSAPNDLTSTIERIVRDAAVPEPLVD